MKKIEYDFLTWTSFPSSLKLINDEPTRGPMVLIADMIPVSGGRKISYEVQMKSQDALPAQAGTPGVGIAIFVSPDGVRFPFFDWLTGIEQGTHDWKKYRDEKTLPTDARYVRAYVYGGTGRPGKPGINWYDDFKIYQDDKLIYENKFSNWLPYQIAGAIALSIPTALYAIPRLKRR